MRTRAVVLTLLSGLLLHPGAAAAETVSRSYAYFAVGGRTIEQLMVELVARGPFVRSSGRRHAGATDLEFNHRVTYKEADGRCGVIGAKVTVKAKITLPRWQGRNRADAATRTLWDALQKDIRRHEEDHVAIARRHARDMERTLTAISRHKTCEAAVDKVHRAIQNGLRRHDQAQARFDREEARTFEARLDRLARQSSGKRR